MYKQLFQLVALRAAAGQRVDLFGLQGRGIISSRRDGDPQRSQLIAARTAARKLSDRTSTRAAM